MLSNREVKDVIETNRALLECGTLRELQRETLARLEQSFQTSACFFHPRHAESWRLDFEQVESRGIADEFYNLYARTYWMLDPFAKYVRDFPRAPDWLVKRGDELVNYEALVRSDFYTSFMARFGMHHSLVVVLAAGGRQTGLIGLFRGPHERNFSTSERDKAAVIGSFLVGALERWMERGQTGDGLSQFGAQARRYHLTAREAQVMMLVASGLTNVEIADRLCVSLSTVQTHLSHIFAKLQVRNRASAIVRVLKLQ